MSRTISSTPAPVASTAELQSLLQAYLDERGGCRVANLERRPSEFRSSYELDEIDARLDDGSVLRLIWKATSRRSLNPDAIQAKPELLDDPLREIEAYRRVLAPHPFGTAACYGAIADREGDRYGLLLEWVAGLNLSFVGEIAIWQAAARWLARLHDRFADLTLTTAPSSHLLIYDRQFFGVWIDRALRFCGRGASNSGAAEIARLARLAEQYDRIVNRLVELPKSLIHGEFFASNVIVDERPSPPRICAVDWELAGIGPRWLDLAALVAGDWSDEQRESMLQAYYLESKAQSASIGDFGSFTTSVDLCRLQLAVQMLGWSATWRPQSRHSHDWLADAINLSNRFGLV